MKIIGITGKIGSGKSTIANHFKTWGIPIFDSDSIAKSAYHRESIQRKVQEVVGPIDFTLPTWNKALANIIFSDEIKRTSIELIIHEFTHQSFLAWVEENRHAPFLIKESALPMAFKNELTDFLLVVEAPFETRFERVKERSGLSFDEFIQRDKLQQQAFEVAEEKIIYINNDNGVNNEAKLRTLYNLWCIH